MPRKREDGAVYAKAALQAIKASGTTRELYIAIHGKEPGRVELQRFANRFNPARSNPGADFLGLCVAHLPGLEGMTLREFFGIGRCDDEEAKD